MQELRRWCRGVFVAGSDQAIGDVCQVNSFHFPRLLAKVPAESITGNLEQPCAKQCSIANLSSFEVDGKQHFLSQVFGQGQFATACPEKGDELRSKSVEQVSERIFVGSFQKLLRHRPFIQESSVCDRLAARRGRTIAPGLTEYTRAERELRYFRSGSFAADLISHENLLFGKAHALPKIWLGAKTNRCCCRVNV
jgi:hypothetical protein